MLEFPSVSLSHCTINLKTRETIIGHVDIANKLGNSSALHNLPSLNFIALDIVSGVFRCPAELLNCCFGDSDRYDSMTNDGATVSLFSLQRLSVQLHHD